MAEKEYKKIPGRGFKRGTWVSVIGIRARLWRGKDHILSVINQGYSEEYKRFYYKDIQAFTIRKTKYSLIINIIISLLFLFCSGITLANEEELSIIFWFFSAIPLAVLILNIIRGKSCITHLHTAVGSEELPSLGRVSHAKKVITLLQPFIDQAQGKLSLEEIRELSQKELERKVDKELPRPVPALPKENIFSDYKGKFHTILFALLLTDAIISYITFFQNSIYVTVSSTMVFCMMALVLIVALIKQRNSMLGDGIIITTWLVLVYVVISFIMGYVIIFMFIATENPEALNNQWEMLKIISNISPADNQIYKGILTVGAILSSSLGIAGLFLLNSFSRKNKKLPATPPLPFGEMSDKD